MVSRRTEAESVPRAIAAQRIQRFIGVVRGRQSQVEHNAVVRP
jgi:hypothetical protein